VPAYFTNLDEVKTELAHMLGLSEASEVEERYDTIIDQSIQEGYEEIVSSLAARGYSITQIESWDRRARFNIDLALFWSLTKGVISQLPFETIRQLDRRKELESLTPTVDGVPIPIDPTATSGNIGYGRLKFDCRDTFSPSMEW
jgi:hypothetical protein